VLFWGDRTLRFKISLAESGRYVICEVFEAVTSEFALEFGKAAVEASHDHGVTRQLYDVRCVRNTNSVFHNYDFAYKDMVNLELEHDNRAAILVDPTDRSHDFVEIVSRNAGYKVRVFIEEERAIAWLEDAAV
jgi:hypothetical protein